MIPVQIDKVENIVSALLKLAIQLICINKPGPSFSGTRNGIDVISCSAEIDKHVESLTRGLQRSMSQGFSPRCLQT